jgi:1-acyl-sn-glycerol-3-phosphate acyltransferase
MIERPDRVEDDRWWRIALVTVGLLFRACLRLRVEGLEHIPERGAALLAANHVSPLDPIAICIAASRRGRTVRYLGAIEAFSIPLIGWGLRRLQQIPLKRGKKDLAAIEEAARVIAAGSLAGIFPEGRLGTGDGFLPPRSGMARLALAAGVPVIPIGVWGMQVRWRVTGIRWKRPLRPVAAVVIGEPIPAIGDLTDADAVRGLTEEAMTAIVELAGRARAIAEQPRRAA